MKILLVDDDPICHLINEKLIAVAAGENTPEVISFLKADEALVYVLDHLQSEFPEELCIFLDINMPVLDGWDFLKGIKDFWSEQISVFILSSSVSETDKKKALEYQPVSDFLIKPLSIPVLKDIFERNLIPVQS